MTKPKLQTYSPAKRRQIQADAASAAGEFAILPSTISGISASLDAGEKPFLYYYVHENTDYNRNGTPTTTVTATLDLITPNSDTPWRIGLATVCQQPGDELEMPERIFEHAVKSSLRAAGFKASFGNSNFTPGSYDMHISLVPDYSWLAPVAERPADEFY